MQKKQAMEIFNNLDSEDYTVSEKVEAIIEVINMPTHNSVKKADMLNALRFLAEVLVVALAAENAES